MVETYKYKSKAATAISFIAALIAYLGKDGLAQYIPPEYASLIPILVFAAGYVLTQKTEDTRVETAEQMVHEEYAESRNDDNGIVVNVTLDGEDIVSGDVESSDDGDDYSSSSGGTYVASSNSNKFHYPSCSHAKRIKDYNRITFSSRDEAINAGYEPCSVCCP